MSYLLVFIAAFVAFKIIDKIPNRKPKQLSPNELPDGIITPSEALMLDESQKKTLQGYLNWINGYLKSTINAHNTSCIVSFADKINKEFPVESLYEIERLYKKAGWKARLYRKTDYTNPYNVNRSWWEIKFKLPYGIQIPSQINKVRVQTDEPSLEELGIDILEQKFKELEKKTK